MQTDFGHETRLAAGSRHPGPEALLVEGAPERETLDAYMRSLDGAEWLLWDAPERRKREILARVLEGSAFCAWGADGDGICALAWIVAISGRCGNIHFSLNRRARPHARWWGRKFLAAAGDWASLLCLIPWPNRAARAFARDLGFASLGRLPGACWLAGRRKLCDGDILMRK